MEKKIIPYKPFSKNYDVVIAIDFGTARSGFAFAFFTTCAVHVYSLWDRQPLPYPKTPTRLAYRSDNHIDFGWTASKEFLQKNHIYKPHYLFQKNLNDSHSLLIHANHFRYILSLQKF